MWVIAWLTSGHVYRPSPTPAANPLPGIDVRVHTDSQCESLPACSSRPFALHPRSHVRFRDRESFDDDIPFPAVEDNLARSKPYTLAHKSLNGALRPADPCPQVLVRYVYVSCFHALTELQTSPCVSYPAQSSGLPHQNHVVARCSCAPLALCFLPRHDQARATPPPPPCAPRPPSVAPP